MSAPPPSQERKKSVYSAYIVNHTAANDQPPATSPPAVKSWLRRGSATASQEPLNPTRVAPPTDSQPKTNGGSSTDSTANSSRQLYPASAAAVLRGESAPPTPFSDAYAASSSPHSSIYSPSEHAMPLSVPYPKPNTAAPLTDLPPPVMPPPMRSGRPYMDPDEAAAERARRADEHRIKMRERKEAQAVEALMFKQEQRMSRRTARQPTKFVPKGKNIPPVPVLPGRDALLVPPQSDIDEQGRRSTLEENLDNLIAENSVHSHSDNEGSTSGQNPRMSGVSQAPSFPLLDQLQASAPAVARVPSYQSLRSETGSQNPYRLSAAISIKDGQNPSYAASDGESHLDTAFDLGPETPTATARPTSTFLSPNDAARTLNRQSSLSSTYLRSNKGDHSDTELLPDDGTAYNENIGTATKRLSSASRVPSSQRNTRTVSILKYTDDQVPYSDPIRKVTSHNVTFGNEVQQVDLPMESIYDSEVSEFLAFEDLTLTRRFAHLCMIFPYSILGFLVRYGLNNLFEFDGSSIGALLWSQGISGAIFGLVLGKREDLATLYPPIWTGLSVGFAGSINSFSGWMLQSFTAFSNFEGYDRGGFQDALDGLSVLAVTLVICQGAMSFGIHVARYLPSLPDNWHTSPSRFSPTPRADIIAIVLSVVSYVVAILSYAFFSTSFWRNSLVFPMILAPGGAVVRYYMSRLNATSEPLGGRNGIPAGTLLSNLLGTAILAACYVLMRADLKSSITVGQCAALNSLSYGFAGTMTNLAAMVFEARAVWVTNRWRWAYTIGSIFSGQMLMVAIFGGIWWGGTSLSGVCSMR